METETITLELSKNYLMFAEYYAKKYGTSITEMFVDYLKALEKMEQESHLQKELIKSLRGMASHSSFSSDEFAHHKEIERY